MANARERADWPEEHAPVVSDVHPAVQAVLDIYRAAIKSGDGPEDLAARYAAAVLRVIAEDLNCLDGYQLCIDVADEIDPPAHTSQGDQQ